MSDIFISHGQEDSAMAAEIALGLGRLGFSAWYYERDSLPGTPWLTQVGMAIEQAGAVVLLVSRHSLDSGQVTSEIDYARSKDKAFIPVRLGVTHEDIEQRQRQWAFALGTRVDHRDPERGPDTAVPRPARHRTGEPRGSAQRGTAVGGGRPGGTAGSGPAVAE